MQKALQDLIDRQAILACLDRYARGLDRKDIEMLQSAYHPDATDHHGSYGDYYPAPQEIVTDWLIRDADRAFSQHLLLNSSIEINGDEAHGETYFQVIVGLTPEAAKANGRPPLTVGGGRYIDRFERRAGEWRIARRVLISEFACALDSLENPHALLWARRSKQDPSYDRPLLGPPSP
jgi:hypothetical protein